MHKAIKSALVLGLTVSATARAGTLFECPLDGEIFRVTTPASIESVESATGSLTGTEQIAKFLRNSGLPISLEAGTEKRVLKYVAPIGRYPYGVYVTSGYTLDFNPDRVRENSAGFNQPMPQIFLKNSSTNRSVQCRPSGRLAATGE